VRPALLAWVRCGLLIAGAHAQEAAGLRSGQPRIRGRLISAIAASATPEHILEDVSEGSGLGTPRTRVATEYVFATLSRALRAGISEHEQQAARDRFTAPGRDESFVTETRVWSRSRFRPDFQLLPCQATRKNSTGLKHAGKRSFKNGRSPESPVQIGGCNVPTATDSDPLEFRFGVMFSRPLGTVCVLPPYSLTASCFCR
jgi:hypothetical protein